MEGKKRYSDEELEEFRAIINQRLEVVKSDYEETMKVLMNKNTNDVNDTSPTYKALEEGSTNQGGVGANGTATAEVYTKLTGCIGAHRQQDVRHRPHYGRANSQGTPPHSAACNPQRGIEASQ